MITCTFEDGGKGTLRHVVFNAIAVKDNKVLLEKRAERLTEGGKWSLIGGFLNKDENIEQRVRREAFEETGYRINNLVLFRIIDNPKRRNEDRQTIAFVYTCEVGEKEGEPDDESTDIQWFDLENLPSEEEMAFDHLETINLYLKYKKENTPLPIFG